MAGNPAPDRSARVTYKALASIYDELTALNDHEMWVGWLLPELEKRGLRKGRLLDVGCGTGKGFEPMLRRGWEIVGIDPSPEMLERARLKFGDAVRLEEADARDRRVFGEFDLVWALNGVVNSLLLDGDLERAFAQMRANLAPGGLVLFDADTLKLYGERFASGPNEMMGGGKFRWVGQRVAVEPGAVFEAKISGAGVDTTVRLRHYETGVVEEALEAAGLESMAVLGQREFDDGKVALADTPVEGRDYKLIHIARAA